MIHHLFTPAVTIKVDDNDTPTEVVIDWGDSYDNSLIIQPGRDPVEVDRDDLTVQEACAWADTVAKPALDTIAKAITGDLYAAIEARGLTEKLVAVAACHEIARAIRAVAPTAVALLVEDSDQNDRSQLVPCSLIDADGNVLDVDVDVDEIDDNMLTWYVGQLDEYNEEAWGPAQEREPDRRLIIERLDQVTGG